MSRKQPKSGSKTKTLPVNFPSHDLPAPFARLQTLGEGDFPQIYDNTAQALREGDAEAAVTRLIEMILDERYYDYNTDDPFEDPRGWTRLHALRVLIRMGPAAQAGIEPLLLLLNDEDDYVREELPFYYAEMGQQAVEPLERVLRDQALDTYMRGGAGESLAEIGEKVPELRPVVIPILEETLLTEQEDPAVAAFLICSLLDLGSRESLPLIEKAFEEERVDEMVVCLADVQEHFGLPITADRPEWDYSPPETDSFPALEETDPFARSSRINKAPSEPYVAPPKTGRNDPCPCGSGKKYKKCCGAAA